MFKRHTEESFFKYESKKGFNRLNLLKLIYNGYRNIYDEHELEIDGESAGLGDYILIRLLSKEFYMNISYNQERIKNINVFN